MLAIRGAISVPDNTRHDILAAAGELLGEMQQANGLAPAELVAVLFTLTPDLNAAFPAEAARNLGWNSVGLMCMQEVAVPGALPRVLRVMMLVERPKLAHPVHVYRGDARRLRPDLTGGERAAEGAEPPAGDLRKNTT